MIEPEASWFSELYPYLDLEHLPTCCHVYTRYSIDGGSLERINGGRSNGACEPHLQLQYVLHIDALKLYLRSSRGI